MNLYMELILRLLVIVTWDLEKLLLPQSQLEGECKG